MCRILIVDDSDLKVASVKGFLMSECNLKEENFVNAKSALSGWKEMENDFFDLIIFDIILPQFENEPAIPSGGKMFLNKLDTSNDINLLLRVVCLTEKPEIAKNLSATLSNLKVNVIAKDDNTNIWIDLLSEEVKQALKHRSNLESAIKRRTKFNVGIVCAIQVEFRQLLEAFGEKDWKNYKIDKSPFIFKRIKLSTLHVDNVQIVAACANSTGGIATAVLSSYMFKTFDLDYMFMTGITGGIENKDEINLGDIIVSQSVQEYAVGKISDGTQDDIESNPNIESSNITELQSEDKKVVDKIIIGNNIGIEIKKENKQIVAHSSLYNEVCNFISKDLQEEINNKIVEVNKRVKKSDKYSIHISPTASGPFVVTSKTLIEGLKSIDRKLRAVDMEGYGLYYTAHIYNKPALWIKSVSDLADKNKGDEYHEVASYSSAYFLRRFITDELY